MSKVASKTKEEKQEKLITPFAIIYEPTRDGKSKNHPQRYPMPLSQETYKDNDRDSLNKVTNVNFDGDWIIPGKNTISEKYWEHIKKQPEFATLARKGVFVRVDGIPTANPTNTLEDYEDENAIELVNNTYDLEELKLELARERRVDVIKAIQHKIREIEEEMSESMSLTSD